MSTQDHSIHSIHFEHLSIDKFIVKNQTLVNTQTSAQEKNAQSELRW